MDCTVYLKNEFQPTTLTVVHLNMLVKDNIYLLKCVPIFKQRDGKNNLPYFLLKITGLSYSHYFIYFKKFFDLHSNTYV